MSPQEFRRMAEAARQDQPGCRAPSRRKREALGELGLPEHCARPACRRARACVSDRYEFDWSFPGPWMPPCAGTYRLVDLVRGRIHEICESLEMP
jgi:hypothetical protein